MPTREHASAVTIALLLVIGPIGATARVSARPVGPPAETDTDARAIVGPADAGGVGARAVNLTTCQQTEWDQKEQYGPTNVNAQLGNQELSVAVTRSGTFSVFKWPRPSYYDQIKYYTHNRSKPRMGADANAGAFLGLVVSTDETWTNLSVDRGFERAQSCGWRTARGTVTRGWTSARDGAFGVA